MLAVAKGLGVTLEFCAVPGPSTFEFRRSERVNTTTPIEVCGFREGMSLRETATTLIVNEHGALISVAIPHVQGQTIQITNVKILKGFTGDVVCVGTVRDDKRQVAIRFKQRSPDFGEGTSPPKNQKA